MALVSHASKLAVPFVILLICFLSFSSQLLFQNLEPEPLSAEEKLWFNVEILAMLICYVRCCITDPGYVPANWEDLVKSNRNDEDESKESPQRRWCKKCDAPKPPRAHHCKICKR